MKDWINPELLENKYDNRRKILTFPQGRLFTVSDSDPKEFRRFVYAVRGLVEAVEVTESGQTINKANNWIDKILGLDKQEVARESTPAEQGQLQDNVITVNSAGRINWRNLAVSGDIGNWMGMSFLPVSPLNLYEIIVRFLRENGLWIVYNHEGDGPEIVKNTMPADLTILSIEYDFGSQRVNFLVWSQYFEKNTEGAIPMVHELMFADLKPIKSVVNEDGIKLRKLLIGNELETEKI